MYKILFNKYLPCILLFGCSNILSHFLVGFRLVFLQQRPSIFALTFGMLELLILKLFFSKEFLSLWFGGKYSTIEVGNVYQYQFSLIHFMGSLNQIMFRLCFFMCFFFLCIRYFNFPFYPFFNIFFPEACKVFKYILLS